MVCINPLTLIRKDLHSVPSVNQALFINREKKVKVVKAIFQTELLELLHVLHHRIDCTILYTMQY